MAAQKGQLLPITIEMFGKATNFKVAYLMILFWNLPQLLKILPPAYWTKFRLLGATVIILCLIWKTSINIQNSGYVARSWCITTLHFQLLLTLCSVWYNKYSCKIFDAQVAMCNIPNTVVEKGMENKASFMMQALELLWLAKRHISGQSDVNLD